MTGAQAAVQRQYHDRLFRAVRDWDTASSVISEWLVDQTPAGIVGLDQQGHFGPTGCDLLVDQIARDFPDGVGLLLELGSGLGGALRYTCDQLRRRGVPVAEGLGVELVAEQCRASEKIARSVGVPGCHAVCASADRLPLDDGTVDAIMVTGSMPHFATPARVLAEAARVLRPTGTLVVTEEVSIVTPGRAVSAEFRELHPEGVFFLSSERDRREELEAAGLTGVQMIDLSAWAHQLLGERLKAMRLLGGMVASFFGPDETARITRTLAAARAEYSAGNLVPMLVCARPERVRQGSHDRRHSARRSFDAFG